VVSSHRNRDVSAQLGVPRACLGSNLDALRCDRIIEESASEVAKRASQAPPVCSFR